MALHRARHTYDPARPFVPWLYAIVQNRLVDALRVQRRRLLRELDPARSPEPVRPPVQERDALARDVRRAVASLPDNQRKVIELLKLLELSPMNAHISAAGESSPVGVSSRCSEGGGTGRPAAPSTSHRCTSRSRARDARGGGAGPCSALDDRSVCGRASSKRPSPPQPARRTRRAPPGQRGVAPYVHQRGHVR